MRTALVIATPVGAFLTGVLWWLGEHLSSDAIGMAIGLGFGVLAGAPAAALPIAVAGLTAAMSIVLAFAFAALLGLVSAVPLPTLALATAPGGVSEMCITAKVLQLGVPLVTVCHVLRVVVLTVGAQWSFTVFRRLVAA